MAGEGKEDNQRHGAPGAPVLGLLAGNMQSFTSCSQILEWLSELISSVLGTVNLVYYRERKS